MTGDRLLGTVRLSHLTDETTSPERQRDQIMYTAKARGDTLIHIAEDLDTSGAVSAWNRDLAPWLTEPDKIDAWDSIIVAKLDRLTRSLLDFQRLLEWCKAHGKGIISVTEGFDLSSPYGRMMANTLIMYAEFERERMSERRAEAAQLLKSRGWWGGERYDYGWHPVKVDDHWELEPYAPQVAVVERAAREILAGKSAAQICRELVADHAPTQRGGTWQPTTLLNILRDEATRELLPDGDWARVQIVLDSNSSPKINKRQDAAPLLGVAFCPDCGAGLRANRGTGYHGNYYRCYDPCTARRIWMEGAEAALDDAIMAYDWVPVMETRVISAGSRKAERIADIKRSQAKLNDEWLNDAISQDEYDSRMATLKRELVRVKDEPEAKPVIRREPTGQIVGEVWPNMDPQAKRRFCIERGIKVYPRAPEKRYARRGTLDAMPTVVVDGGELAEDAAALMGLSIEEFRGMRNEQIRAMLRERGLPTDPADVERLSRDPDKIKRLAQEAAARSAPETV
jgi:site-specific DNA recombinase